jgi:N-sulfoglucosamine sulfohydrolase
MPPSLPVLAAAAVTTAAVSAVTAVAQAPGDATARPKRNIVLVIADDLSPTLGCYGDATARTPHLDALAAAAVRFPGAFATTASCSASRSVVLTGLHNHANGQYGHQHDFHGFTTWLNVRSLPVMLEECGYRTAQIGKFHVAPEAVYRFGTSLRGNPRNPVQMAEACREFISADDARPFFLYFATADPHRGGGTDDSSPLALKPDRFGNRPDRAAYPGVDEEFFAPGDVAVPPFLPDTPECRAELAHYYQSVSRVDQGLGRLVEVLEESGVWDDTLLVFTSDHGMAFPGAKTNVYEPALRVPLVVRDPYSDASRGGTCDALVSLLDLTPTLLDFAGGYDQAANAPAKPDSRELPPPAQGENRGKRHPRFHGRSFLAAMAEPRPAGWDRVTASHTFHEIQMYYPMRAVRDREFKLIWNIAHHQPFPFASDLWAAATWQAQWRQGPAAPYGERTVGEYVRRPEFELYDLRRDPNESTNLAGDPAHAAVLDRHRAELRAFQEETGDPWVLKWSYE